MAKKIKPKADLARLAFERCINLAEEGAQAYRKMEAEEDSKHKSECYRNSAAACKVMAKKIREMAGIKVADSPIAALLSHTGMPTISDVEMARAMECWHGFDIAFAPSPTPATQKKG